MLQSPDKIPKQFTDFIKRKGGRAIVWSSCDTALIFSNKYGFNTLDRTARTAVLEKLKAKNQAESLGKQAHHAVSLRYEMAGSS